MQHDYDVLVYVANWPEIRSFAYKSLLIARAIENQAYVIAPGQCGIHDNGRETYGHSMLIDPWGRVLAGLNDEPEGVVIADIEQNMLDSVRRHFPSLKHRRL